MPITTRTIAKGIPPRLHQSRSSQKKKGKSNKSSRKRAAPSSDEESESEPEPEPIRKKGAKSRRLEVPEEASEEEEEEVVSEHASEPPELIDDVDNRVATLSSSDEQDVRIYYSSWSSGTTNHILG